MNKKKGLTFVSIVIYVILFFVFTTLVTIISTRINKRVYEDRGRAINSTSLSKLQYNLLKSAEGSYKRVDVGQSDSKATITFDGSDEYVYNKKNRVLYKNNGVLLTNVIDINVSLENGVIKINLTLKKYVDEINRDIFIYVGEV